MTVRSDYGTDDGITYERHGSSGYRTQIQPSLATIMLSG